MASASYSNAPSYSVLAEENALLREQLQVMQRQLDWFKKQLFGPKSEKQVYDSRSRAACSNRMMRLARRSLSMRRNARFGLISEAPERNSGTTTA